MKRIDSGSRCIGVALLLAAGVAAVKAEVPSAIAIKDARVVTISGADLPKATVVLRDGLIESVGENAAIPSDAWQIDGTGLIVYPGFIDGLSDWGIAAPPATNTAPNSTTNPPTTVPRSHGPEDRPQTYASERAADLVNPSDNRLAAARAAGFTSAATFPNRGIFEGLGALIDLAGERGRDMVIAQPIGQRVMFRVGGFGSRSGFPSSLMGNISYVRQLYLDLDQYERAKKVYAAHPVGNRRPEYDHALEGLTETPRVLLPAEEVQEIDRILSFGQELKTPFVIYGLHEGFRRVDALKQAGVPLLISLKWPQKPKEADPAEVPAYRELVMRDQAPAVPGLLAKAGVKFGFYSDGVNTAPELRRALKKAIDAGLPRTEAVRALTLNIAEMYGVADRMGSIEKGKIANLVVTRGEAFEESATIEYVFIDGRQFKPSKEEQQGPPNNGAPGVRRPGANPAAGMSEGVK